MKICHILILFHSVPLCSNFLMIRELTHYQSYVVPLF
nr:MAG TPA: hypothetical protein [Caudoviricetes sp.]